MANQNGDGARILLVDDHREFVFAARALLERNGYRVAVAYDGRQALDWLENQEIKPDLIILDVMMPQLNGWEALQILKSRPETKELPVLMLTALNEPTSLETSFELGCTWFYTKPINDHEDFILVIERILADSASAQ